MPVLLAIDDDPMILEFLRRAFSAMDLTVEFAENAAEGLLKFEQHRPDAVLLDLDLPDISGIETYRRMRLLDARVPTIFLTGGGTTDTAIEAMRLGAYDYLLKPPQFAALRELVGRAIAVRRLMSVPARVGGSDSIANDAAAEGDLMLGRCPAMQEVYKAIGRVAAQDVTVLILGESGTGKELVARAIYQHSNRSNQPFLAINCAAIPENLLESELFGHESGAFTSANKRRIGKFEQCNGGTLFLDEIGDMSPLTQTKMLRVLQKQEFERVGGNETIRTDVRVIAATNHNLEQAVAAGRFRSDLYYRLNVYAIRLPPLRDREGDLPDLVRHFVRRFARDLGKEVQEIAPEALECLQAYSWPGNIRELQGVLKHSLLQATGPALLEQFLPASVRRIAPADTSKPQTSKARLPDDWARFIEERLQAGSQSLYAEWQAKTDRPLLARLMEYTGGNQSQAARILGIHRGTLRAKLEALGISGDQDAPGSS